jgi:hypothetical protein
MIGNSARSGASLWQDILANDDRIRREIGVKLANLPHFGVPLTKLTGAANSAVAAGHAIDRFPRWALSGTPTCCGCGALTRKYTTDCGSWQLR